MSRQPPLGDTRASLFLAPQSAMTPHTTPINMCHVRVFECILSLWLFCSRTCRCLFTSLSLPLSIANYMYMYMHIQCGYVCSCICYSIPHTADVKLGNPLDLCALHVYLYTSMCLHTRKCICHRVHVYVCIYAHIHT